MSLELKMQVSVDGKVLLTHLLVPGNFSCNVRQPRSWVWVIENKKDSTVLGCLLRNGAVLELDVKHNSIAHQQLTSIPLSVECPFTVEFGG